jgi:serine/threonine protein kinase
MNLEVGSQIGDYQVVGILGAGGMGKVYQVRNVISDRVEAMKVLLPDLVNEPDLGDRFLREIKVQASLEHANIASLHTAVRVENQLLMLMEYVEGETLEQRLKRGPLPTGEAVEYIRQVLAALDYAHARGVIHRDIKPANMMLTPGGVVKLMDFGIAKSATDRRLTMTGTTMGSLYYMSPEQIKGSGGLDARSDLYSVGVSLYELVTGKHPFDGDSQFAIMAAHLEQNPVPPIQLDPRLPQTLNDAILMSVAKDPNTRFQTAGAFRNALATVALPVSTAVAAPPLPQPPKPVEAAPSPVAPRGKRGLCMGAGAIAAAVGVMAFIEFGPKVGTKAAPQQSPVTTSAPAPVTTPPVVSAPPADQPQQTTPPPSQPMVATPNRPAQHQTMSTAPRQVASSPQVTTTSAPPPQSAPSQAPSPQTAPQAAPPPPSTTQQTIDNAATQKVELQKVREELVMMNSRAGGIRGTLQSMQRSLAARGGNLNASLQVPADNMDQFLQAANDAVRTGDVESAKSYMQKAEIALEKLESLLNR